MSGTCERAQAWSSRDLDDELSDLEAAMLRRHLQRCEVCAGFVERTAWATRLLREAPLEDMTTGVVVVRPHRGNRALRAVSGLAAACVVLVMAGITVSREMRYQAPATQPRSPIEQRLFSEHPKLSADLLQLGPQSLPLPVGQRNARDDF